MTHASSGMPLLQRVAERILLRWLVRQGRLDARATGPQRRPGERGVDLTYTSQGRIRRVTVKPDPYCGTDSALIADRALSFYRADSGSFGLEAVSDAATRAPGWAAESDADDVYYYYLALGQAEDEIAALAAEPDEVFFSELEVGRDDLFTIPASALHTWFDGNAARYPSRPVISPDSSAWYRMVPRADLESGIQGVRHVGPVFRGLRGV